MTFRVLATHHVHSLIPLRFKILMDGVYDLERAMILKPSPLPASQTIANYKKKGSCYCVFKSISNSMLFVSQLIECKCMLIFRTSFTVDLNTIQEEWQQI